MQKMIIPAMLLGLLLSGCNANIVGQDNQKLLASTTPTYLGIPNPWYLYDDAFEGGPWLQGLDFYDSTSCSCGAPFSGTPVINFSDTTSPDRGQNCMRFAIPAQSGTWWCGMIFLQKNGFTASNGNPGVDIRPGNFTKCVFRARTLQGNRQVKFEVLNATNTLTTTITSTWQTYTIPFTVTTAMPAVRQFFSPVFAGSAPTTVTPIDLFIDDLRFEQ